MTKGLAYLLGCLVALPVFFSCNKERGTEAPDEGGILIRFATGNLQSVTKGITPGDGVWADGGGIFHSDDIPDLVILIADPSTGNIIKRYSGSAPTNGTLETVSDTQGAVKFDFSGNVAGQYNVYAFGNTLGLWDMTTDGSNTLTGTDLMDSGKIANISDLEALRFKPLTANVNPELIDLGTGLNRLPVSAKGTLTVSDNKNGEARLELLRCVAKVTAVIINNTPEPLKLYSYYHEVKGICPDAGYVLLHDGNSDYIGTPGNLIADIDTKYGAENHPYIIINEDGSEQEYSWYVFPSEGPYSLDMSFTLYTNNDYNQAKIKDYSYSDLSITNWKMENIPALKRNQHLIVETRLSRGLTVSFNIKVVDWTEKPETVQFD